MNRLKKFRENNNLSQSALSRKLKEQGISISQNAISKYEKGERNPSELKWKQLAKFFKTNVASLKGDGIDQSEVVNTILHIIHNCFFSKDLTNPVTKQVNIYLNLTNQSRVPYAYYKKDESKILNENIKSFWINCFNELITNKQFISSLIGINDKEILYYKIAKQIEKINIEEMKKRNIFNIFMNFQYDTDNIENYISTLSFNDQLESKLDIDNVQIIDHNNNDISKKLTIEESIDNQINLLKYLKEAKNDKQ
ncbi:MAG: helix-turn-helix domain-containing protein [Lactobacillaceae bacterium]